ncbi:hypothetical protein QJS10_CPA08g00957 [Acorus calamus]|uniref:Uncharacterized protein n=1 Tax=Acorus calamus TaxID=4465 RepID=A0AAV9E8P9_ACOCL|nr:hypothetical protein QJS10_CPA08g00957 [Acorus calamus]
MSGGEFLGFDQRSSSIQRIKKLTDQVAELKAQLKLEKERCDKSKQGSNNLRSEFREINAKGSSNNEIDIPPLKLKSFLTPCRLMSGIERDIVAVGMAFNEDFPLCSPNSPNPEPTYQP